MTNSAGQPPSPRPTFWGQIWVNTASWLIVCGVAGVAYIAFTVPRMLDAVLRNQDAVKEDMAQVRAEVAETRAGLRAVELRTLRLEAHR